MFIWSQSIANGLSTILFKKEAKDKIDTDSRMIVPLLKTKNQFCYN